MIYPIFFYPILYIIAHEKIKCRFLRFYNNLVIMIQNNCSIASGYQKYHLSINKQLFCAKILIIIADISYCSYKMIYISTFLKFLKLKYPDCILYFVILLLCQHETN